MAHSAVWDETAPPGNTTPAASLDTVLQNMKRDIRERAQKEHSYNGSPLAPGTTYDGVHLEGSARVLTGLLAALPANRGVTPLDGAAGNEDGRIFISTDSGEILYSDGTNWLTALKKVSGPLNVTGTFQFNGVNAGNLVTKNAPARTFTKATGVQAYTNPGTVVVTSLGNIAVPGTPNGSKKYEVSLVLNVSNDHGTLVADLDVRIRMGPLGTSADPTVVLMTPTAPAGSGILVVATRAEITPASGDKITVTFGAGRDCHINGDTTNKNYMLIEEVLA